MHYCGGTIAVPTAPGLGVKLYRDQAWVSTTSYFFALAEYPYDQDPLRPGWTPTIPNQSWADPNDARTPAIPF